MPEHAVDANAFIHALRLSLPIDDPVTVPQVVDELESREARQRYDLDDVSVYVPDDAAVERVRDRAADLGEDLSPADTALVALALERDAVLVTDDYGMQNVAETMGLVYEGMHQDEIDEQVIWKQVCSSCGATVDGERCGRCGGDPERVPADDD